MSFYAKIKEIVSLTDGNIGRHNTIFKMKSFENKYLEEYQRWMRLCYSTNILCHNLTMGK